MFLFKAKKHALAKRLASKCNKKQEAHSSF
jgi:hypothetical protein